MKKTVLYTELAYVLGMVGLSLSVALMTRADFGVSMVVAPAYLLYLKLNPVLPFFTFGMAEYTLQAALLLCTILTVKKFRPYFLFSFVTAVLYGFLLDGWMLLSSASRRRTSPCGASGTCWAWGWARSASPVSSRPTSPRRSMSCW